MNISSLRARYTSGETTPSKVLQSLAESITVKDQATGAYLSYDLDRALEEAATVDLSLPLGGIPIAFKDNLHVKGEALTCASKFLKNYRAPYDATVVKKLRAAGAIPFGRLNMDEFAMGSATENSAFQLTRNPHDPTRIAGGSSGGSAAAVADGTAVVALGSDTGGSIRQPASHCGVVGFKPSYGRVSRSGLVAFASSLDQIGPVTRCVEDAARLLQVMAGHDALDSTSLAVAVPDYLGGLGRGVKGLKLGIPKEYFADGIEASVRETIEGAVQKLVAAGAELVNVSLPHTQYVVATYYVLAPAEASSNLSRFDGVRYGHRSEQVTDILSLYEKSRDEGFGPEVKRRIILGTYVLSSGYYDAYYTHAQKIRTLIRRDFDEAFQHCDAIISPVAPTPARKIGASNSDLMQEYMADVFTLSANLAGLPAISVPCGTAAYDGAEALPVGLQVIAPHLAEAILLQVAAAAEVACAPSA